MSELSMENRSWGVLLLIVVVVTVAGLLRLILYFFARDEAESNLLARLANEDVKGVQAVLLVSGRLLRKDVRDAAQVWLQERDS
jgi:enhancing lycopene biosynthesis protein 2